MKHTRWLVVALALPLAGCSCHSTESTQVGVLTRKTALGGILGKPGVQDEVYPPGATYLFFPLATDWHVFDVSLQNLAMVRDPNRGDRTGEDDLFFKTVDGNDIRVDVTVAWQIDPERAAYLLRYVGGNTEEVKEKLMRPACRAIVRDVLNELSSEDFYVSDKRFEKANKAKDKLQAFLGAEGILVQQVILGEHHFGGEYEKVIQDKKLAEQNAEKVRSETHAAQEQARSNLERAKGTVAQQIAQAEGAREQAKLNADADFYQSQQHAQAILAEKKARAKATQKQNEAMSGLGGKTMVKLRVAEALEGKELVFVPTGKGGVGLHTLNLNELINGMVGAKAAEQASPAPASTQ